MARRRSKTSPNIFIGLLVIIMVIVGSVILWEGIPWMTEHIFGRPVAYLNNWQKWSYSLQLLLNKTDMLDGKCEIPKTVDFVIQQGESVTQIATNLASQGIIRDSKIFRIYLIYSGIDTLIRADNYNLDCSESGIKIAETIKNPYITEVKFTVLPGWRAEEIAAALPTSGLSITPDQFLQVVHDPTGVELPSYIPSGQSLEGFLFPGEYLVNRNSTAQQLAQLLITNFNSQFSDEIQTGIVGQGLSIYQGIILASIVQRETYDISERPMIASVFFNRLRSGMNLETDPTVQYALGYSSQYGWWKSPLTETDLQTNSAYNTYMVNGLPPTPIANPDLSAILAVAYPQESDYLYFRAACDGSGRHLFARTFEEHIANQCK